MKHLFNKHRPNSGLHCVTSAKAEEEISGLKTYVYWQKYNIFMKVAFRKQFPVGIDNRFLNVSHQNLGYECGHVVIYVNTINSIQMTL